MKDDTDVNSNIFQYADDTFIIYSGKKFLNQNYSYQKFTTTDLKIKQQILPVEYLIKYRVIIYYINLLKENLPAFDELKLATLSAKMSDRTNNLSFGANKKKQI